MRPPETKGSALLAIAERALMEDVLPALPDERRPTALMIASAIRMVARELEQTDVLQQVAAQSATDLTSIGIGSARELAQAIRSGTLDHDPMVHAILWVDAAVRTIISKPSHLSRAEHRLAHLDP